MTNEQLDEISRLSNDWANEPDVIELIAEVRRLQADNERARELLRRLHVPCDQRFSPDCSGCNADLEIAAYFAKHAPKGNDNV